MSRLERSAAAQHSTPTMSWLKRSAAAHHSMPIILRLYQTHGLSTHHTRHINTDGYAHMESNRYGRESSALGCAHKTNIDAFLNDQQRKCIYARTYGTVNTSGSTISIHDLIWNLAQYTPVKHWGAAWIWFSTGPQGTGDGVGRTWVEVFYQWQLLWYIWLYLTCIRGLLGTLCF